MGSRNGNEHEHDHDTHYHGEPSRVLDDRALPEAVVLYPSDPSAQDQDKIERWLEQLGDVEELSRVYVPDPEAPESSELEILPQKAEHLSPFSSGFKGFPESLKQEPSLLFLPVELTFSPTTWKDLRANDVTVNWITVDTNPQDAQSHPRVIVLSDWVTAIGNDVHEARSTGVTSEVFHLTGEDLADFENLCATSSSFSEVFESFLDDPAHKLRPCFLHEREWKFG